MPDAARERAAGTVGSRRCVVLDMGAVPPAPARSERHWVSRCEGGDDHAPGTARRRKTMAEDQAQHYQPEQTGMYELEFPAPQLSSADGRGPVLIHALEGFSDAGHAIRLAAEHLQEHPGHRAGGVVRHRRTAGLPVAPAADDVQDRPLHPLRRPAAEPLRPARQRRHAVSAAGRHWSRTCKWERFITAVRLLAERLGRAPDHRAGHHPDGGAAHPADHDDRALQQPGADRRPHSRGSARCRCPAACRTCSSTGWPSTATRSSGSPSTCRTIWPRPTTRPPPRRCSNRWPRRRSLAVPLRALTDAAAEVRDQDRRAGRGQRRSRSSGDGAGAPVRCIRCRSGEPVAAGTRRGSAQRRRTRRRVRAVPGPAGRETSKTVSTATTTT